MVVKKSGVALKDGIKEWYELEANWGGIRGLRLGMITEVGLSA